LEPSLSDRVRELALDAEVEREALERRKAEALEEREAEVAKVRERYRVQLDAIEAELALAARLRRALDPDGAKREAAEKRARVAAAKQAARKPGAPSQNWRPKPEVFVAVLSAMDDEHETVNQIAEAPGVNVSTSTIKLVMDYSREAGHVRLAGTTGRGGAKRYRLTPQGREHLESASMNGASPIESHA
jgi:predicted transcriptional regulator